METFQTCLDILSDTRNKGGNFENKAEVIAAFAVSTNIKTVIKSILGHINSFKATILILSLFDSYLCPK